MERIKIRLPGIFNFHTTITIRITDLNYGGHVGNDVFLSLLHEARVQYLQHLGYSELNFEGTGLIMADVGIEYKRELKYGDEVKLSLAITAIDKSGFDIHYLMEVKAGDDLLVAGKAKTGMVCFDYAAQKRVSVPQKAIEHLATGSDGTIGSQLF
jgi:acyl-CoA thioester hydrolase